jgi:glutamate dehydrogenase (NADP+)
MPSTAEAQSAFIDAGILYGPAKAANAGGVAVSGLEMSQNSLRISWSRTIHETCLNAASTYDCTGNYLAGSNIAGFLKVADAMLDQGLT